jgi:peptidoglycan hydrolase-like protein with peptidoglycan-binding domain
MRFAEFKENVDLATAIGKAIVAGVGKDASGNSDTPAPAGSPAGSKSGNDVEQLQKELKAAGADLGDYGPNKDGIDGMMGPYTRKAAAKFPDIAKKYKELLDKPDNTSAANIDTAIIQDPDFNKKLNKIADALGVSSKDLLAIMKQESGVDPKAVNKMSGATGLIQFMPDTARRLGTSVEELRTMDAVTQLDYVYKYFRMVGVKPGMGLGDLYMAVFMPAHVGKDDNFVLGQSGATGFSGKVYAQNKGLDKNKDGAITVADVKSSVQRFA